MAQSLVKLTLESNQYERGIRQAQKTWNDFTRGLGISIGKFTAVGAAIGAVTGALKVAKDAFFKNEQQLDEWNRAVESSKSVYSGFLNALNTGDISGFLSNINTITEAARAAYDALDELSTFNAFNQIQTQKSRTGFTEAMAGFRLGENSKEDVQKAAKEYQEELRTRQKKEKEAYMQFIRKIAAERGVSWGALEQALTGKYGDYEQLKNTMPTGKQTKFLPGGQFGGATAIEVPMAVTAQEKMGQALRALNDTELKELQALGAQAYRTGEEIAQIDKQMARVLNKREGTTVTTGGGGGNTTIVKEQTELQQNQKVINDLTQEYVRLGDDATTSALERKVAIQGEIAELEKRNQTLELYAEQAKGKFNAPKLWQGDIDDMLGNTKGTTKLADTIIQPIDEIRDYLAKNPIMVPIEAATDNVKKLQDTARTTAKVVGTIGQAFNAIEDPAGKVAAVVAQAIANVALAYSDALAKTTAEKFNIWSFIAASASAMISMGTTIASIHSATGYAQGGMIKGNSYSGDNVGGLVDGSQLVGLNAGELVLTKAMQSSLANQLQNNGQTIRVVGKLHGKDLFICAENWSKSAGHGEFVTW